jgi:hypothetical protein
MVKNCSTCKFSEKKDAHTLLCKRYPPNIPEYKSFGVFPLVPNHEICGEWKNKISIKNRLLNFFKYFKNRVQY